MFKLSDMDYVRGAIANALAEDMTLNDLWKCAAHAKTAEDAKRKYQEEKHDD